MKIDKSNNQYYGRYFEEAIVSLINKNQPQNNTGYNFEIEEILEMNHDAQQVANFLQADTAFYVGRETSNQNADIIVNEEELEIKYVSGSTGTYFNTSINYLESLGFESYHNRLFSEGYLQKLKDTFGDLISLDNNSPVSNAQDVRLIRASKEWLALERMESQIRVQYVKDFFNFLQRSPEKTKQFVYGLITKTVANKTMPSRIIIFNHKTKKILEISNEALSKMLDNKIFRNAGKSFVFDDFRIAFGWQNGNGLRNPTLRVFLK